MLSDGRGRGGHGFLLGLALAGVIYLLGLGAWFVWGWFT